MALGFYFSPASMTAQQYDEITKQLAAAGAGNPKDRMYHTAFGQPDHILVFDVWESQADFDAFEDRGEHALKGIEEPVRVFAVRAGG